MATTTNYGWTTPDDTALVKDGAAAIRTLGTSIDTTTKNLNPSTTLGDIEYRSSTANTNTRLGIGSTGQVLTVSGGVPSWQTSSSGGMTLLSTTNLSGSQTVTVSSINQTHSELLIVVTSAAIPTGQLRIQANGSTSDSYVTGFDSSSGVGFNSSNGNVSYFNRTLYSAYLRISNYASTTIRKAGIFAASNQTDQGTSGNYFYNSTSAITSIDITNQNGNFTGGQVQIWGVK